MKRLIALGIFILLLAIAATVWLWLSRSATQAPVVPIQTADYGMPDAWAVRPDTPPPAVWQGGWAVDVFLVINSAARSPGPLKTLAVRDAQAVEDAIGLREGLATIGPVYAPVYSASDADADLERALDLYLSRDNRGRAFVIATDRTLPASLVDVVTADTLVRERFGGILHLSSTSAAEDLFEPFSERFRPDDYCPDRLISAGGCIATVITTRKGGRSVIAAPPPDGGIVLDGYVDWLNTYGVQLAEPLGELEDIPIIDIRRPGETDASDGSEDNNTRP